MATVARLLPRYWDARRLLQFLTGLALIALAFAIPALLSPAADPAESPITVVTTVDTPLSPVDTPVTPDLPQIEIPAPTGPDAPRTGLALSQATTGSTTLENAAGSTAPDSGPATGAAVRGLVGVLVQVRHDGRKICAEAATAESGVSPRAHGQRGPPRT